MDHLRALYRLVVVAILTIGSFALLLLIAPLRGSWPARHLRLRNTVLRRWSHAMARAMGMRVTVFGKPPTGAFFLVANHLSYMDIMLLGAQLDAAFVAKAQIRNWPVLGPGFASADTLFVDRGRRRDLVTVMAAIERSLGRGLGVVLFAEGTSGRGERVLPFKPSILELAVRAGRPVRYATLTYHTQQPAPPADKAVCWWGEAPLGPHLWRLLRMRGFDATLRFGTDEVTASDRKSLALALHQAVSAQFEPVVEGRQPAAPSEAPGTAGTLDKGCQSVPRGQSRPR